MPTSDTPVVLVVEDDPPVRELLNDVLEGEGYAVVAVHDGTTALQVIDSLRVDLITLDLELPGLSGSDLLEILRKRKAQVPPVIVVSSIKPPRRRITQMAQVVLSKPFDVDEFLNAVLTLLPLPGTEAKNQQLSARATAEEQTPPDERDEPPKSTSRAVGDAQATAVSERALQAGKRRRARSERDDDPERSKK
jgi:DNA-binding response OmpR family regulator